MDFSYFEEIKSRAQHLNGVYTAKKKALDALEKEVTEVDLQRDLLQKTEKVLKHLVDKLVQKDLQKMDKLITFGLNTVFSGKDLRFESQIKEQRGKITIALRTIFNGEEVDSSSMSSISVIESFLLRLLCIIRLKKAPLMLMDETFPAVDSGYMENLSKLIYQLSEKLGIDVLAVTHTPGLSESAKTQYRLTSKKNSLGIEKIK